MSLGTLIRKVETEDRNSVLGLVRTAFDPERVDTIVDALWHDDAIEFEYLTEISGVIVGYCAFTKIKLAPPLNGMALQLSPVAVAPEYQRKGIGTELVKYGIDQCRTGGAEIIAVLGHADYYPRFGFTPAHKKNVSWGKREVGDALQVIDYNNMLAGTPRDIIMHPAFTNE